MAGVMYRRHNVAAYCGPESSDDWVERFVYSHYWPSPFTVAKIFS